MEKNIIPICFAIDDAYTPFLAVALQSLIDNASKEYNYCIKVLHTNVKEEHMKQIKKYENEYVNIEFVDLNYYLEKEWKKEFYGEGQLFFWYKRNKKTEMQSATDQYGLVSVKLSNYVLPIPDAESQYN